ncbi:FAD-dependent oxidoreductase, partial [candidate division KSB1 bacterium]
GIQVKYSNDTENTILKAEKMLVAIGVRPNTENIGLEETGVELDRGFIKVDEFYRTNVPGVYAIGDCIGGVLLAHVASTEGITCIEKIAGHDVQPIDSTAIPGCIYCQPQVASIGLSEEKAKEQGYELKIGKYPFRANGKSVAAGETEGFVKLIFDAQYGELLGAHIIGHEATEMIAEMGLAKTLESTYLEILKTIHAHPTVSESIMEAAGNAYGEAIHI